MDRAAVALVDMLDAIAAAQRAGVGPERSSPRRARSSARRSGGSTS